jgi:hypothetical protein
LPSRKHSDRKQTTRPDRDRAPRTQRLQGAQLDEAAFTQREEGRSFSAIARILEFKRTKDALEAFHRALRSRTDEERTSAIGRERVRLDGLEARIRGRDVNDPDKRERRLAALENLRNRLT